MSDVIVSPGASVGSGGYHGASTSRYSNDNAGESRVISAPYSRESSYFGSDYLPNSYNMNMYNTSRRNYKEDVSNLMNYNNLMFNTSLAWSERMSNTAIQRQVQDLIKAGLNPVLAARLGGATYHMPNTPYMTNAQYQNYTPYDSSISRQESINKTQIENNIRDNFTRMSITEIEQFNANLRNALDNETSRMNTQDRIEADKYLAEFNRDTQKTIEKMREIHDTQERVKELMARAKENQKDRDFQKWQTEYEQTSEDLRNYQRNLANMCSSAIVSIGHLGGSAIGAIGRFSFGG